MVAMQAAQFLFYDWKDASSYRYLWVLIIDDEIWEWSQVIHQFIPVSQDQLNQNRSWIVFA